MEPIIFVVDDKSVIANTLAMILKQNGFDAKPFTNPLNALNAAESKKPNLLISDVMMSEINGIELAIRMKQLCPGCKVLLFSGQAATSDLLAEAREDGHDFVLLAKPVHPGELLKTLRSIRV